MSPLTPRSPQKLSKIFSSSSPRLMQTSSIDPLLFWSLSVLISEIVSERHLLGLVRVLSCRDEGAWRRAFLRRESWQCGALRHTLEWRLPVRALHSGRSSLAVFEGNLWFSSFYSGRNHSLQSWISVLPFSHVFIRAPTFKRSMIAWPRHQKIQIFNGRIGSEHELCRFFFVSLQRRKSWCPPRMPNFEPRSQPSSQPWGHGPK